MDVNRLKNKVTHFIRETGELLTSCYDVFWHRSRTEGHCLLIVLLRRRRCGQRGRRVSWLWGWGVSTVLLRETHKHKAQISSTVRILFPHSLRTTSSKTCRAYSSERYCKMRHMGPGWVFYLLTLPISCRVTSVCAWETPTTWNTIFFSTSAKLHWWKDKDRRTCLQHPTSSSLFIFQIRKIMHTMYCSLACFKVSSGMFLSSFRASVISFRSPSSQSMKDNEFYSQSLHSKHTSSSRTYRSILKQRTHQMSQRGTLQSWYHFCTLMSSCRCNLFLKWREEPTCSAWIKTLAP